MADNFETTIIKSEKGTIVQLAYKYPVHRIRYDIETRTLRFLSVQSYPVHSLHGDEAEAMFKLLDSAGTTPGGRGLGSDAGE